MSYIVQVPDQTSGEWEDYSAPIFGWSFAIQLAKSTARNLGERVRVVENGQQVWPFATMPGDLTT